MSIAYKIANMSDRTDRERRDMAELHNVNAVDFNNDCCTCTFSDGSVLMMRFENDFIPVEFLVL